MGKGERPTGGHKSRPKRPTSTTTGGFGNKAPSSSTHEDSCMLNYSHSSRFVGHTKHKVKDAMLVMREYMQIAEFDSMRVLAIVREGRLCLGGDHGD